MPALAFGEPKAQEHALLSDGWPEADLEPPSLAPRTTSFSALRPIPASARSFGQIWSPTSIYDLHDPSTLPPPAPLPHAEQPVAVHEDDDDDPEAPAIAVRIAATPWEARALLEAKPPPSPQGARRRWAATLWLSLALWALLFGGLGLALWTPYGPFGVRLLGPGLKLGPLAEQTAHQVERELPVLQREQARDEARARLRAARGPDLSGPQGAQRLAWAMLQQGDPEGAERWLTRAEAASADPSPLAAARARLWIARGEPQQAKAVVWEALDRRGPAPSLRGALLDAYKADPRFAPPLPLTLRAGKDFVALTPRGAGFLGLGQDQQVTGRLWPYLQSGARDGDPRGPAVAWRLCALLRCGLDVPYAREARLDVASFDEWTRGPDGAPVAGRDRLLVRVSERGTWVEGTWQEAAREGVPWPTAQASLWEPWLRLEQPLDAARPAQDAVRALPWPAELAKDRDALVGELEERDVGWLAGQLSQALAMDYLLGRPQEAQAAISFRGLTPLDLARAWEADERADEQAQERLRRCQRFSRTLIQSLRALDEESLRAALNPTGAPSDEELRRLLKRRERLLAYTDLLISQRGEEAILAFP
jgi:hypothetical protein